MSNYSNFDRFLHKNRLEIYKKQEELQDLKALEDAMQDLMPDHFYVSVDLSTKTGYVSYDKTKTSKRATWPNDPHANFSHEHIKALTNRIDVETLVQRLVKEARGATHYEKT